MLGPNGIPLTLSELALFFLPHGQAGHSGSCVWPGGRAHAEEEVKRTPSQEVRFVWPEQTQFLRVTAQGADTASPGESRSYRGEIVLKGPSDPCQMRGM